MKFVAKCLILAVFVFAAAAQVMTGRLEGTVTDSQGASIPASQIKVMNGQTGQNFSLVTDEKGSWSLPSLSTGTYTVTISHTGFKTSTINGVKVDAGVPAT